MSDAPVALFRRDNSDEAAPDPGRRVSEVVHVVAPPWLRMPSPRRHLSVVPDPVAVHRPAIVSEAGLLGLSRLSRGRWGARAFVLFFVGVYTLILWELAASLLRG